MNTIMIVPASARTGAKDDGLSSVTSRLSDSMPVSERIQDVAVVPMLAPMMMHAACSSFMMPEFTNPTTMTVVAPDD